MDKKKVTIEYVSNKKFYNELVRYKKELKDSRDNNRPLPQVPNYIGECLYLIATRLSNKANFIGYPHKDEMIADGIENSIKYLDTFNPERTQNPFAYFTQAIKNAFIRRIQTEKKQLYLKMKSSQNFYLTSQLSDNKFIIPENEDMNQFIKEYEESILRKKLEAKGLERVISETDENSTD